MKKNKELVPDIKIICLTPIKNEDWILDRFLTLASEWAHHIIIANQGSSDKSKDIADKYPKVVWVENESKKYDEDNRQKLLINKAREIKAHKRILIALDADEAITFNWKNSKEWNEILNAPRGTVIYFKWINLLKNNRKYAWVVNKKPYGFIDDEITNHEGSTIHSTRIPVPNNQLKLELNDIGILHFMYLAPSRVIMKKAWYQCWERISKPKKRAVQIYRYYNKDISFPKEEMKLVKNEWIYFKNKTKNVDLFEINDTKVTWWEKEILQFFNEYGTNYFRKVNIWNIDWELIAERSKGIKQKHYKDPRNNLDKLILDWLEKTQDKQESIMVRVIQKLLQLIGW